MDNRIEAADLFVRELPKSAAYIKRILKQRPHRFSAEVQYSLLNLTDGGADAGEIALLLPTARAFLQGLKADVAVVPMKTGCLLGDGWYRYDDSQKQAIVQLLTETVLHGRHVVAREAAFHGIEHLLNNVDVSTGKRLLNAIAETARSDRSRRLRNSAQSLLARGRWWGSKNPAVLVRYAKKLGAELTSK